MHEDNWHPQALIDLEKIDQLVRGARSAILARVYGLMGVEATP